MKVGRPVSIQAFNVQIVLSKHFQSSGPFRRQLAFSSTLEGINVSQLSGKCPQDVDRQSKREDASVQTCHGNECHIQLPHYRW
jgi:hypothetical protein